MGRTRRRTRRRTRGHCVRRRTPRAGSKTPRRSTRLANKRFKKNMSMTGIANILEEIVELPLDTAVGVTKSAVGVTKKATKAAKKTAKRIKRATGKLTKRGESEIASLFANLGL